MQMEALSLDSNMFSLGALLGTSGSQQLLQTINNKYGGGSFFGSMEDPFRSGYSAFMNTIVQPLRAVQKAVASTAKALFSKDKYRAIDSRKELEKGIPPCMQLGIIYYPPIRKMLESESIDGFGFKPEELREDDPYQPLLDNGYKEFSSDTLKDGKLELNWYEYTDSPELEDDEIKALRKTREYIDRFIVDDETQCFDFTSFPDLHS